VIRTRFISGRRVTDESITINILWRTAYVKIQRVQENVALLKFSHRRIGKMYKSNVELIVISSSWRKRCTEPLPFKLHKLVDACYVERRMSAEVEYVSGGQEKKCRGSLDEDTRANQFGYSLAADCEYRTDKSL
jgi:hypothetical protein